MSDTALKSSFDVITSPKFTIEVCVSKNWTDEELISCATSHYPLPGNLTWKVNWRNEICNQSDCCNLVPGNIHVTLII
jgi:hypothetical protein